MKRNEFDFERANLLMQTVVEAGKHGLLYQKLAGWAGEELKDMMQRVEPGVVPQPQVVTTNAGPNSALVQEDGSLKQIPSAPLPSGVRDETPVDANGKPLAPSPVNAPARTDRPQDRSTQNTKPVFTSDEPNPAPVGAEEPIDRRL